MSRNHMGAVQRGRLRVISSLAALVLSSSAISCAVAATSWSTQPRVSALGEELPPDGWVDRIEGDLAVIVTECGALVDWPAANLTEGDIIREGRPDPVATARLAARVEELRERLSSRDTLREEIDL